MIFIKNYISGFSSLVPQQSNQPWEWLSEIELFIIKYFENLKKDFIFHNGIAIHKTAIIETNVILKSPAIIGKNCFIAANAYIRGGVYLTENVTIGPGCEIKSSIIFNNTTIAHFNFIGNSLIGCNVNFEAGALTANHFNERLNKDIFVMHENEKINTKYSNFGSLVGDNSKIGANAVLSPGTLLSKNSVVKRLQLIDQIELT